MTSVLQKVHGQTIFAINVHIYMVLYLIGTMSNKNDFQDQKRFK